MKITIVSALLILLCPNITNGQDLSLYRRTDIPVRRIAPLYALGFSAAESRSGATTESGLLVPLFSAAALASNAVSSSESSREERTLKTGRVLGAISGSSMGLFALYLGIKGDEFQGPFWKTLAISVPSTIVGAYAGIRGTEWVTRKIIGSRSKIGGSALRGAVYGFADGALIGVASLVPLLTLGHCLNMIDFGEGTGILEVIGNATLGGVAFGGMIGAVTGLIYGPCISIYMKF